MIQCVGSREEARPYCSRICCSEAIKNALEIIPQVAAEFNKTFKRNFDFIEEYKLNDAELAIVVLSSTAGTAKIAVDKLREKGLIKKDWPVKVLGDGEIKKALTVKTEAFSKQAIEKIKAAGGTAETKK